MATAVRGASVEDFSVRTSTGPFCCIPAVLPALVARVPHVQSLEWSISETGSAADPLAASLTCELWLATIKRILCGSAAGLERLSVQSF